MFHFNIYFDIKKVEPKRLYNALVRLLIMLVYETTPMAHKDVNKLVVIMKQFYKRVYVSPKMKTRLRNIRNQIKYESLEIIRKTKYSG